MSEYRRFISYMYEYKNGKKSGNCGYAKVEVRAGVCRVNVHVEKKETLRSPSKLYGFVRTGGKCLGIFVGEAQPRGRVWDFQVSVPAAQFAQSDYTAEELNGLWVKSGSDENYITVWDDEQVDVDAFVTELADEAQTDMAEEMDSAREPENGDSGTAREPQTQEMTESGTARQAAQEPQSQAQESTDGGALHVQDIDVSNSLAARWQNFLYHYPQLSPFDDAEITECICIAPKDLAFLPREERQFSGNPFLQEGYEHYGHLLLGCHQRGRFVLAVPGTDGSMQDKHLARMCGFPFFKQARESRQTGAPDRFGYWYHFLNEECPRGQANV